MVTSPPYAVGKDYDEDLTLPEYRKLLRGAWKETRRLLVPGGRVCINVANIGRKPYIPLHAYIIQDMERLGFLMRGEIIWDKGSSAGSSTAWGSWLSASNPTIRDQHEYILLFSKEGYRRPKVDGRGDTIGRDQFLDNTRSVWRMTAESAKRVGHPAPFPVELPRALHRALYIHRRGRLRPLHGQRHHRRGRDRVRPPLRRLRDRPRLPGAGDAAHRGRADGSSR